jgi:hypothetical protein
MPLENLDRRSENSDFAKRKKKICSSQRPQTNEPFRVSSLCYCPVEAANENPQSEFVPSYDRLQPLTLSCHTTRLTDNPSIIQVRQGLPITRERLRACRFWAAGPMFTPSVRFALDSFAVASTPAEVRALLSPLAASQPQSQKSPDRRLRSVYRSGAGG